MILKYSSRLVYVVFSPEYRPLDDQSLTHEVRGMDKEMERGGGEECRCLLIDWGSGCLEISSRSWPDDKYLRECFKWRTRRRGAVVA